MTESPAVSIGPISMYEVSDLVSVSISSRMTILLSWGQIHFRACLAEHVPYVHMHQ